VGKGDEEGDHGRGRDVIKLIDHSIAILLDARCYVKKVDSESKVTSSGFLAFLPNIFG
jgi:hypothetical protein